MLWTAFKRRHSAVVGMGQNLLYTIATPMKKNLIETYHLRQRLFYTVLLCITTFFTSGEAFAQTARKFRGLATYYSSKMHGARTSDGSRYDKNGFTCAHRTLPFGTMLKVTNLTNGKTTRVKVTDRGPFGRKRLIIDLSNSAAAQLDMLRAGIVEVEVEVLPTLDEIKEDRFEIKHAYPLDDFFIEEPQFPLSQEWMHSGVKKQEGVGRGSDGVKAGHRAAGEAAKPAQKKEKNADVKPAEPDRKRR